jgi:hypothetical protein
MKPPTLKEIGTALKMSAPAVHKHKNNGMPVTSIEEAVAWHKRNVGYRRAASPALREESEPDEPDDGEQAEAVPLKVSAVKKAEAVATAEAIPTDSESCREALKEARELRKFARQMVARCNANGDNEMSRRWTQTHQQLLARQAVLENQFRNLLERDGETIAMAAAEARFRTVLQDLKMLATAMPAAMAGKVNPQDPLHAQKLLEEWRDKTLFKSLYANT